jgi:hypothetical protein
METKKKRLTIDETIKGLDNLSCYHDEKGVHEFLREAIALIQDQKQEIERLTESYLVNSCMRKGCYCSICEKKNSCDECRKCDNCITSAPCKMFRVDIQKFAKTIEKNAELQKQADDLKERAKIDLANEKNWGKVKEKQAVKDTAEKIYCRVLELIPIWGGYQKFIDDFEEWLKESYGVEVE